MTTIGELLEAKKKNCCEYLDEIIQKPEILEKLTDEQIEKYKKRVEIMRNAPLFAFIFYINSELIPNKDRLEDYTNDFLKLNGIEDLEPFEEYKKKIERYLKLFIDIITYEETE